MDEAIRTSEAERSNERANELRSSARTEQIEVRVRHERHRNWGPDEKLRMVRETLRPGAVIAEVARRHGIGTGLLYTWRRAMLASAVSGFVPAQVQPALETTTGADGQPAVVAKPVPPRIRPASGRVEVEFPNGVRVRVDGSVDAVLLRGVLTALDDR
jgi:transposase